MIGGKDVFASNAVSLSLSLSQYGKYLTSIITQRVGISHAQPLQNLIEYLIFYQILYVVLGAHPPGAIDESVI